MEDIDWQGLRDRYVSNIGSQIAYGQQAASQYLSSYFSNIDPRNPGTGRTLDGQKMPIQQCFNALRNGSLKSVVFSTTGGMSGGSGEAAPLAGAFSLAVGRQQGGRRRPGSRTGLTISGEDGSIWTAIPVSVDDLPFSFEPYSNFWELGNEMSGLYQMPKNATQKVKPSFGNYWKPAIDVKSDVEGKFLRAFDEIQTDACEKYFQAKVKELLKRDVSFYSLLRQTRFNYYNPARFNYPDINEKNIKPNAAFAEVGTSRVFITVGFNDTRINGGRVLVHELFHRAGVRTLKKSRLGGLITYDVDPVDSLDNEIEQACAPNSSER